MKGKDDYSKIPELIIVHLLRLIRGRNPKSIRVKLTVQLHVISRQHFFSVIAARYGNLE